MLLRLALITTLIGLCISASTSPTWAVTTSVKTGTATLFSVTFAAGSTQSFGINFPTNFVGGQIPYLVYGIQRYKASDFILQQFFEMTLENINFLGFQLNVQVTGVTNPTFLSISYMAIAPGTSFPYYVNTFVDVPLAYNNPLTNFSLPSSSIQSHTEALDYTNDLNAWSRTSPASIYTTFATPFTNYKIAFLLTSLGVTAISNASLFYDISYQITTASNINLKVSMGYNATISFIKFSMFVYDSSQFSIDSNKYLYFYELEQTDSPTVTAFFSYNSALSSNFMMGLKSFSSTSGQCYLQYQWATATNSTQNGAEVKVSTPSAGCGLKSTISTILYMMVWACPGTHPLFDLTTKMCLDTCNPYNYKNTTDNTCRPCSNSLCYTCNQNISNICLTCATNWKVSGSTCICDTSTGQFHFINGYCYACGDLKSQCLSCSYTNNISLAYDSSKFTCLTCNNAAGYFIDPSDNCVGCSVSNCVTCIGYATCSVCATGYGVTDTGSCSTCPLSGCQTCASVTQCSVCKTGYTLMSDKTCKTCSMSCVCQGYTLPRYANGDCSTVCGDSIKIFPYEECDDGNSADGDGCSSSCAIEDYSSCSGSPSVCYFNSAITATLVSSAVSEQTCNLITLRFRLSPYLALYNKNSIDWYDVLQPVGSQISSADIQVYEGKGEVSISFFLTTDLQDRSLSFKLLPQNLGSANYLRYADPSTFSFTVVPSNNIPALYLDENQCSGVSKLQSFSYAQTSVSYAGLFMSLFSGKIVGLQMFGLLQLSYFSLSNYDYVPSSLTGLLNRKQINGLNVRTLISGNSIPSRVSTNGYSSSQFLSNFNIMFLLTIIIAFVGLVLYLVTYIINRNQYEKARKKRIKSPHTESRLQQQQEQKQSRSIYWHRISKYILKEVLLTFMIFSMFNISFSAGMQIRYIQEDVDQISIICLLITLTITIAVSVALMTTSKDQYGEFIQKFKQDRMESKYMITTIIYRFSLGLLMALINQWIFCGLVYTFISGMFLAYICYYEPFVERYQNIRSKFIHSIHVLVLFINFYYRLQANGDPSEAAAFSFPAYLQIIAIAIAVFGSTILLAYQFVKMLKEKCCCNKQKKQQQEAVKIQQYDKYKRQQITQIDTLGSI